MRQGESGGVPIAPHPTDRWGLGFLGFGVRVDAAVVGMAPRCSSRAQGRNRWGTKGHPTPGLLMSAAYGPKEF